MAFLPRSRKNGRHEPAANSMKTLMWRYRGRGHARLSHIRIVRPVKSLEPNIENIDSAASA
jgi:hypothetical protein